MDFKVSVPAIEKLVDYAASGIGSVAGSMLASWKACQEARAKAIAAEGEVEAQKILTAGQADTLQMIANAQANARSTLVSPNSAIQGQLDFANTVTQRIQFQEDKRQSNIGAVVRLAASELEGTNVQDHEPDHDWTARFFNDIQDVSAEETRVLYGKILAGEVERPGSTSVKTLSILKDLDKPTATLFVTLCSACISICPGDEQVLDARVVSLGGDAGQNDLDRFGLSFINLNILNEHGLIIADYKSWYDIQMCIGTYGKNDRQEQLVLRVPFKFQNRYWILEPTSPREIGTEYRISGVALTKVGRELSRVVECQPIPEYTEKLETYFSAQGFHMFEVGDPGLQVMNRDMTWESLE